MKLKTLFVKVDRTVKKNNVLVIQQVIEDIVHRERLLREELDAIVPVDFKDDENSSLQKQCAQYWKQHNRNNIKAGIQCHCSYCFKLKKYIELKRQLHRLKRMSERENPSYEVDSESIQELKDKIFKVKTEKDRVHINILSRGILTTM